MPQPTVRDVHVNRVLTNISIAMLQNPSGFIADRVFAPVNVANKSNTYRTYTMDNFNRNGMKKRAPGAESAGSGWELGSATYSCDVFALHKDIDDQTRANEEAPLSSDRDATIWLAQQALINKEVNWTSTFFTSGVWGTDMTGVAASPTGNQFLQWNDAASDPIADIRAGVTAMLLATGKKPNTLVLGYQVLDKLLDHIDVVDRIKYGTQAGQRIATAGVPELSELLRIPRVEVMEGIQNTANEGAAASNAFIGGKQALLCYSNPTPSIMQASAGYTFTWTGYTGTNNMGVRIKKFREERLESDRIEIGMAYDQKVIAPDLGYMYLSAVA